MPLTLDDISFLSSDRGRDLLRAYAHVDGSDDQLLPLLSQLRKTLDPRQAAALLTTLQLRQKAERKFPNHAHRMLFTEESLQQASNPLVRKYRAAQFHSP